MRLEPAEETERVTEPSSLLPCRRDDPREEVLRACREVAMAVPVDREGGGPSAPDPPDRRAEAAALSDFSPDRSRLDSLRNKVDILPVKPCLGRGG